MEFKNIDVNLVTAIITTAISLGGPPLYKWFKKKEIVKTSDLSSIFIKFSLVELYGAILIPLISTGSIVGFLYLLGLHNSSDPNLLNYMNRALVLLLHFGISLFLFYKLKILNKLSKCIKHKIFYSGIFIFFPLSGCLVGFAVIELNSYNNIANVLMYIMVICVFVGSILLLKPKKYNYYSKVKIKFTNGKFNTFRYENFKIEDKFVIAKIEISGKRIKDIHYNIDSIERIEYIVNNDIDKQYENYLMQRFYKANP